VKAVLPLLTSLLLGTVLLLVGNGLLGTVLAVRLTYLAFSPLLTGAVMAAYFVGYGAGALTMDRSIRRVGHIRVFTALAAGLAVVSMLHALLPPPLPWLVLRAVAGYCMAGLLVVIESWMNATATSDLRGRMLAVYMLMVHVGLGSGQLLLGLWPPGAVELFCAVAASVSLAVIPVALTRAPEPAVEISHELPVRRILAQAPLAVVGAASAGLITSSLFTLGPVFASLQGLSRPEIATFMAALILGGVLLQWPLGRLSDRMDRRVVILGVLLATAAVSALLGLVRLTGAALPAAAALDGSLVFVVYPLCVAHAFDRLDRALYVGASGVLLATFAVGAVLGPLAGALAMQGLGPAGLLAYQGAVALLAASYALFRIRRVRPVPVEEQADFLAVPDTTLMVAELDPRPEDEDPGDPEAPGPATSPSLP